MIRIRNERIGCIIWLLCAASIAGLGFWYPEVVLNRNSAPDDRSGFVLLAAMPFYFIGAVIAIRAMLRLITIVRSQESANSRRILFAGTLLAIFSLTPLLIIGSRILLR